MSGNNEESDSWGSLIMNGVMDRMAKMTGLRVVKSVNQNGDHEQGRIKDQTRPRVDSSIEKDDTVESSIMWIGQYCG